MFQIPDDLDFDDEFLDTEFNPDLKTHEDRSLANVNKIQAESSVSNPTRPKLIYNNPKPCSVASTSGTKGFVPKLKKSTAVQEGKQTISTAVTENCIEYNQRGVYCNSYSQDKPYIKLHGSPLGYPSATDASPSRHTQQVSSHNLSSGRGGRTLSKPRSIPVSLNPEIQSNLQDASELPSESSSHLSSSHSEFLAEWNDSNFFNPEPKEGSSSKLRPSSVTPQNQSSTAEAVTRKINKTVRQRRFPGPAGLLPLRQGSTSLIAPEEFLNELKSEENYPTYEETELLSQSSGSIFEGGAWSAMLDDLGTPGQSLLKSINLASIKAIGRNLRSYKVPFLAVLVQSVDSSLPDAAIGFKDPTGEMHGVVHRDVWDQFSSDIAVGTVLVLRNVGIMSAGMSSRQHVVNITGRNLTAIYSPKDELNIQLRQIHAFAASNSSKLLSEWEKVESQTLSASPISSRIKKPPMNMSAFNNNLGSGIRSRHASPYNNMNSGQPRFTPPRSGNPHPQRFSSPNCSSSPGIPRFNSSSTNISPRPQYSPNPFTPMPSRHSDGHSVRLLPPPSENHDTSHSLANKQHPPTQKSPTFAIKAPSGNRNVLPGSSQHPKITPASNINNFEQQPSPRDHSSTSQPTIPMKKPKVCQNVPPNSAKVTEKSNPFQVHDSSAVDSLLEGIDTDSLFGDF